MCECFINIVDKEIWLPGWLTYETSALQYLHDGQITLATLLIRRTSIFTSHRRSTAVSFQTNRGLHRGVKLLSTTIFKSTT